MSETPERNQHNQFSKAQELVYQHGFTIKDQDLARPWGGFLVIDERDVSRFIATFFPDLDEQFEEGLKLSPKILIVSPQAKLSWQYHHRRREVWKVVEGPVAVVRSETDELSDHEVFEHNQLIKIPHMHRHRLVGLDTHGIVAEIWVHVDPENPSDEEDIIRVADDYGR